MNGLTRFFSIVLMLLIVGLVGSGCGSTKTVGLDGSPHRAEINDEAEGNAAKVTLRNGEKLELDQLRIDADSASGITGYGKSVSVATSQIEKVRLYNDEALFQPKWAAHIYEFRKTPSPLDQQTSPKKKRRVTAQEAEDRSSESPSETMNVVEDAEKDIGSVVDTQIPETDVERPDDIAVVIGNTEYKNADIPDVDYAARDAKIMKKYLTRTLGFREENVIYVENATSAAMERVFGTADNPQGQLYNWVKAGESSVFVYYSGHGAPNPESGSPYFIPTNTNPSYLSQNGYPVNQFYENLAQLPTESVTVVLEACFSGVSESGSVVSDISPAVLSVENPVMGMENGIAFTAGAADQVSTWYNDKRHGLFTYYFLKGLRGEADANGDESITAKEMKQYVDEEVPYRARRLHNREQNPQVVGQNLDRVLVRYGDSAPAARQKARLPATTTEVQPSVKQALSLPEGARKVSSVGGAEALQEGDVITTVDGSDLTKKGQLGEIVNQRAPGDTLQLTVLRDGKSRTVSVTLVSAQ